MYFPLSIRDCDAIRALAIDVAIFFSLLTAPPIFPALDNASRFISGTLTQMIRKLKNLFLGYSILIKRVDL
jgi:hypothetical protein